MKGFRDIQDYAYLVNNPKEKQVIEKLKHKFETMLGYRTDKTLFEDKVVVNASNKQR